MAVMKKSLANLVRETVNSMPYIRDSLAEGLMNYSALARKVTPVLQADYDKKINEESIVVAVKRFADELKTKKVWPELTKVFSRSTISMQSDISYALINSTLQTRKIFEQLFDETRWREGEIMIIVEGGGHLAVAMNGTRLQPVFEKLKGDVEYIDHNCALISVKTPTEAHKCYGVIYEMTHILAQRGISIELIGTPPVDYILVNEKDAEPSYRYLREYIAKAKELVKANEGARA